MGVWRRIALVASGVVVLLASAGAGKTKANAQPDTSGHWRFSVTPYLWLIGLHGKVGVRDFVADVDLSPGDILDMLQFGIMGSGEARYGPWVIAADGIYAKVGAGKVLAIRGDTGSLDYKQTETIIQPVGGYSFGPRLGWWGVDVLGGFRYWHLGATLEVNRPSAPSNEHSNSRSWLDVTGGLRAHFTPIPAFHITAGGDGGGGGSKGSWQAYGALGYDAWKRWTFSVAYRSLWVNYDHDNFLFDTDSRGALIAVTYRFY